jgi:hypothetical protein
MKSTDLVIVEKIEWNFAGGVGDEGVVVPRRLGGPQLRRLLRRLLHVCHERVSE